MQKSLNNDDTPKNGSPVEPREPEKPLPSEKPRRAFSARPLLWLLGLLVVFGLGALLVLNVLYFPIQQQMQDSQVNLEAANMRIEELEGRVQELSGLETRNQELHAELAENNLHIHILKARTDVATALLALAKNDPTRARVALSKTSNTLEAIQELLDTNQKKAAEDMQARLKLALEEIGERAFAAESDLTVLGTSLLELENSYFAAP